MKRYATTILEQTMKSLKTRSIGARIADDVYDWIISRMQDTGATFSHMVSMILEDAMTRDKLGKKKK